MAKYIVFEDASVTYPGRPSAMAHVTATRRDPVLLTCADNVVPCTRWEPVDAAAQTALNAISVSKSLFNTGSVRGLKAKSI